MEEAYKILQEVRELLLAHCNERDIDIAYTLIGDAMTLLLNKEV